MAVGTVINGKVLDWEYKRIKRGLEERKEEGDFPLEKARFCI
jgi:hypothetical protein